MATWEIIKDTIKLLQLYIFTNFILSRLLLWVGYFMQKKLEEKQRN